MAKPMTARQRAALRKAQLASARKRKGHFSRNKGKYLAAAAAAGYIYSRTKKNNTTPKRTPVDVRAARSKQAKEHRNSKEVKKRAKRVRRFARLQAKTKMKIQSRGMKSLRKLSRSSARRRRR